MDDESCVNCKWLWDLEDWSNDDPYVGKVCGMYYIEKRVCRLDEEEIFLPQICCEPRTSDNEENKR